MTLRPLRPGAGDLRRRAIGAVVVIALAVLGLAVTGGTASAATLGTLSFTPVSGEDATAITVTTHSTGTPAGCPSQTAAVKGAIVGPGPWSGGLDFFTTTAGVTTTGGDFSVPGNPVGLIAANAGIAVVPGQYTISVFCTSFSGITQYGVFTGAIWFTDGQNWSSTDPVHAAGTTAALAVSPASGAVQGAPVTLTATVSPATAPGRVAFVDTVGGARTVLASRVAVAGGTATTTVSTLAPGNHALTAEFTPADVGLFRASASTATSYAVTSASGAAPTTVTVATAPQLIVSDTAAVTLTAAVSPSTAAGAVQFNDTVAGKVSALGTPQQVSAGTATLALPSLPAGGHRITAAFVPADSTRFLESGSTAQFLAVAAGTVTVKPGQGTLSTPNVQVSTGSACPAGTGKVELDVAGPGAWSAGLTALTVTATGTLPIDTFAAVAAGLATPFTAGTYVLTVVCLDGAQPPTQLGAFAAPLWFVDAGSWQTSNPATSNVITTTTLAISPEDRADLRTPVTLTALVTPPGVTGTVRFRTAATGSSSPLGAAVPVRNGTAQLTTATLPFGYYDISAVFTPTAGTRVDASTSTDVIFVVALPVPPLPPPAATVSGTARVGSTLGCQGRFTNATSLAYAWLRDGSGIAGATRSAYRVDAADSGHRLQCRILATNLGGTTSRTSAPVRVP